MAQQYPNPRRCLKYLCSLGSNKLKVCVTVRGVWGQCACPAAASANVRGVRGLYACVAAASANVRGVGHADASA